ncbi:MAG: DNA alkylation repair protein [Clostridiales bacterium]|nr:DNA alkylation repair protein [Clostridiales bacterium]
MEASIHEQLLALSEPEFQKFSSSLLPGTNNILGVRLPALRKLAKKIAKGDWRAYLASEEDRSFEEIMLQGMVIGYVRADLPELLERIAAFVPKIDNWSVCDSFCSGLKIARKEPEAIWDFLQPYLHTEREFEARFGVVMLLFYFIEDLHIRRVLALLDQIPSKEYYARMAVAWAISICFVRFPALTMEYLKTENSLDDFTYHKALQKITESNCVNRETKAVIRRMKNQNRKES